MRSKELSVELRDRIVLRHRSGEGYERNSGVLKVSKNIVAFIILKWNKFVTPKTLPRVAHLTKLSNLGRRGLGQGGDHEPDGHSDRAPEFLCGDGRTFQKEPSLQHSTNQAFMVEWPDGSHSCLEFAKGT
jgi:hypothetical protein